MQEIGDSEYGLFLHRPDERHGCHEHEPAADNDVRAGHRYDDDRRHRDDEYGRRAREQRNVDDRDVVDDEEHDVLGSCYFLVVSS
jgi:hypothetical protein